MHTQLIAIALSATIAGAPPAYEDAPPGEPDIEAVRAGVLRLRAGARTDGTWGLVGSLISAGVAFGLAGLIGTEVIAVGGINDNFTRTIIMAGLIVAGASQIADGLYDVIAEPATVASADILLNDPDLMANAGLFFLENRALDGRDRRIRSAIAEMTAAAGAAISGALLINANLGDFEGKGILVGITLGLGGIQLITGLLKLFRQSTEEAVYEAVLESARRAPPPPVEDEEEPGGIKY